MYTARTRSPLTSPSVSGPVPPPAGRDQPGLARFARSMVRHRRAVVVLWVAALVTISAAASAWGGDHRVDYLMPGSGSAQAQALLAREMPSMSGDSIQLVFEAPGRVDSPAAARLIADVQRRVEAVPHVTGVSTIAVSPDGTVALAEARLDATAEKVPLTTAHEVISIADRADRPGFTVEAGGASVQNAEGEEAGSEQIGMIAALLILLVAFGSVLAAGLPLLVALLGVGVALACTELLTHIFMVPDWAPNLVTMIGIGVGIDYALFIVTRFRGALADGDDPEAAVVTAVTTAGRAVLFAGGTVVVSLLGLCVMGLDYLYGTAAATVTGVLVVMAAAMTLLPALLGFAGRSIDRLRLPFVKGSTDDQGAWARWSRVVQRHPAALGTAALVLLVALAIPYSGLRFGYPDAGTGPEHLTSRRAYDAVASAFGPGANGPLVIAVAGADEPGVVDRVTAALARDPGIASVLPAVRSDDRRTAALVVLPATGPQDEATEGLIGHLRDDVVPPAVGRSGAEVFVGGATAAFVDESEFMGARLPWFIGAVIALSFALLLVVFRSVLVALKAAAMNVLAIGAAYGVMATALEGGWLGGLLGITEPTPVPAWTPMMMFALLFGLSMDYEVFLLSRIREEYLRSGDNSEAVARGLARTGRVIGAAAAIMVTVFGAFVLSDVVLVKVIGLGLATAVLLDATVVRMVLVPSTMELLGDRNWWMPAWLDRVLPHLDIEGDAPEPAPTPGPGWVQDRVGDEVLIDLREFEGAREAVSSGR